MLLFLVDQGNQLFRITVDVLVPLDDLGVVCSFHAFDSYVDQIFMVVRKKSRSLLRLNTEILTETQQDKL